MKTEPKQQQMKKSNMYDKAKTWNPFKGCRFDCSYCMASFQKQAKRQKHRCMQCYDYVPHTHPDRLDRIPNADIVFVCGNGDISFCDPDYLRRGIRSVTEHAEKHPDTTYYFQTKEPSYMAQFLEELPEQAVLVMTLETNRDDGYQEISKAPVPSIRYEQFKALDYPRKVVTIEPLIAFDVDILPKWIRKINPEYVWLGLNTKNRMVKLPEPEAEDIQILIDELSKSNIPIKYKDLSRMKNNIKEKE